MQTPTEIRSAKVSNGRVVVGDRVRYQISAGAAGAVYSTATVLAISKNGPENWLTLDDGRSDVAFYAEKVS